MQQTIKSIVIFLGISLFSGIAISGPWFTGPILAPAGHTTPRGHTNFEIYGIDIISNGRFNDSGHSVSMPQYRSFIANPLLTHGFTDWMDVQMTVPYTFNSTLGRNFNRLTDVSTAIGLQLLEQKDSTWRPDLRFVIQETFPTGRYDELNPQLAGTDSTGLGSYRTQIAFNFQQLTEVFNAHYLRTRLSLAHLYSSAVIVSGFNSYGGSAKTHARIRPGDQNSADLAFEYTLTQNWVAVMEATFSKGKRTRFDSILDLDDIGSPNENLGRGDYSEQVLAPAIEYNFNANVGVIGGVWFPIKGKNTSNYTSYVLALNAYW